MVISVLEALLVQFHLKDKTKDTVDEIRIQGILITCLVCFLHAVSMHLTYCNV